MHRHESLSPQTGLSILLNPGAKFILPNTVDFITTQGRMKFVRPLYREMFKSKMAKELVRPALRLPHLHQCKLTLILLPALN